MVARRPPFQPDRARLTAAADATVRDPARAVAEVWLEDGEGRRWTSVPDLLGASPYSRQFVVELDEDGTSRLRFGDGQLGMAPPPGTRFTLWCRTGNGLLGNVGRDVLAHLVTPDAESVRTQRLLSGVTGVRNPLPSSGGSDAEPGYRVRTRAPQAIHAQARGIVPADWVTLAEQQQQVRRASAQAGWEATNPQDQVWVQRQQGFPEDDAFLSRLRAELEPYRPAGRGLRVLPPTYVGIDVALRVQLDTAALRSAALQALRTALLTGPDAVFAPGRFTFAEPVWLSQVVAAAAGVEGVVWVQPTRFARWSPFGDSGDLPDELVMAAHEVAQLKDVTDEPWNGTLALELLGGIG
jgi:predicted phage baseplate assembly protein